MYKIKKELGFYELRINRSNGFSFVTSKNIESIFDELLKELTV